MAKIFSKAQMDEIYAYFKDKMNSLECIRVPALKPLNECTPRDVVNISNAYYQDIFSLDAIKEVWNIGDSFSLDLNAIEAYSDTISIPETYAAQTVEMTIIDFNHDSLKTAIGTKDKALLTLQTKNCLNEQSYWDKREPGAQAWSITKRRDWCNTNVYSAIPSNVQEAIKMVSRRNNDKDENGYETVDDNVFILTVHEATGSRRADGEMYPYFATTANRSKTVNGTNACWWTSLNNQSAGSDYQYLINLNGNHQEYKKSLNYAPNKGPIGIAFAFCI